jgi:hypothetical protein
MAERDRQRRLVLAELLPNFAGEVIEFLVAGDRHRSDIVPTLVASGRPLMTSFD